jgi:hypothetical protein
VTRLADQVEDFWTPPVTGNRRVIAAERQCLL